MTLFLPATANSQDAGICAIFAKEGGYLGQNSFVPVHLHFKNDLFERQSCGYVRGRERESKKGSCLHLLVCSLNGGNSRCGLGVSHVGNRTPGPRAAFCVRCIGRELGQKQSSWLPEVGCWATKLPHVFIRCVTQTVYHFYYFLKVCLEISCCCFRSGTLPSCLLVLSTLSCIPGLSLL